MTNGDATRVYELQDDDVAFVGVLVAHLEKTLCVDTHHVYAAGGLALPISAVDKKGKSVDFLLRRDRGIAAAQAFYEGQEAMVNAALDVLRIAAQKSDGAM